MSYDVTGTAVGPMRAPVVPVIDEFDLLYWRNRRVALSPLQARLCRPLVDRFGQLVVGRDLTGEAWPDEEDGERLARSLHTAICKLRKRVEPLGLRIETVHNRGYILEPLERD